MANLKRIAIAIIVIATVIFTTRLLTSDDVPLAVSKIPVRVYQVVEKPVVETVIVPGTTRSADSAMLKFQAAGRVTQKRIKLGDQVNKGDVLFTLYNPEAEPLANVAAQNFKQLSVQAEQAARNFQRIDDLLREQAATKQEWEQVKTRLDAAKNASSAASAQVKRTQQLLDELTLIAPFAGVVTQIVIDEGELVQVGSPAVKLSNPKAVELELAVNNSVLNNLKLGDQVQVQRSLEVNKLAAIGQVTSISPFTESGSLPQLVITLDAQTITPGVAVNAVFDIKNAAGISVPLSAVLMIGENQAAVYRLVKGKVELVVVKPVRIGSTNVVIEGDINVGDKVVIEGLAKLFDGISVKVL